MHVADIWDVIPHALPTWSDGLMRDCIAQRHSTPRSPSPLFQHRDDDPCASHFLTILVYKWKGSTYRVWSLNHARVKTADPPPPPDPLPRTRHPWLSSRLSEWLRDQYRYPFIWRLYLPSRCPVLWKLCGRWEGFSNLPSAVTKEVVDFSMLKGLLKLRLMLKNVIELKDHAWWLLFLPL
jgi:hypothetical protein